MLAGRGGKITEAVYLAHFLIKERKVDMGTIGYLNVRKQLRHFVDAIRIVVIIHSLDQNLSKHS